MKLTKGNVDRFVQNIEKVWPLPDVSPVVRFNAPNEFFLGQNRTATITLSCSGGQWWYSASQPPAITGNPEKITTEEAAEIIQKHLAAVNEALAEMPWAMVKDF